MRKDRRRIGFYLVVLVWEKWWYELRIYSEWPRLRLSGPSLLRCFATTKGKPAKVLRSPVGA